MKYYFKVSVIRNFFKIKKIIFTKNSQKIKVEKCDFLDT